MTAHAVHEVTLDKPRFNKHFSATLTKLENHWSKTCFWAQIL